MLSVLMRHFTSHRRRDGTNDVVDERVDCCARIIQFSDNVRLREAKGHSIGRRHALLAVKQDEVVPVTWRKTINRE